MVRYINGLSLETAEISIQPLSALKLESTMESVEEGQDYEVIVDFKPHEMLNLRAFYDDLEEMGTSIQVGEGDGIYRMHIHVPTENRYLPIDYTMNLGTITKVYIENLIEQMEELESAHEGKLNLAPSEPGKIALVTVSPGPGISRIFASLGANAIVAGGQTMNPSTQEILHAFENMPSEKVIILPNNKNIVMAARNAAALTVKEVEVIPTRTIPQGLTAMLCLDPGGDFDKIVDSMNLAMDEVETGEITTATRTVEIDGVQVQDGEIIALHNGKLVLAASSLLEGCLAFFEHAFEHADVDEYELITLLYGVDIPKNEVNQIADIIREKYPEQELEVQDGGQPHYQFIISIE